MKITFASSYGFCLGVKRALTLVMNLDPKKEKIYLLSPIVHNSKVMDHLKNQGFLTLDDSLTIEEKLSSLHSCKVVFSAHGHDKKLELICQKNDLEIIDTTCPRVKANENSLKKDIKEGQDVIYIGIKNHPETVSALSLDPKIIFIDYHNPSFDFKVNKDACSVHNQTTLIRSTLENIYLELKKKYKHVKLVNDICFATEQNQNALDEVTIEDLIVVIGDKLSSNTKRLYELAKQKYPLKMVILAEDIQDFKNINLNEFSNAFITAGASSPKEQIDKIVSYLKNFNN